ncbi:MAG TPA: hypothetical protein VFV34_14685 [Blastocatellia bacterium]|nr:hypothetical protein [Blastocatellia bacterium]
MTEARATIEDLYRTPQKAEIDLLGADVIKCYKSNDPNHPTVFCRGDVADAEPAAPGWRIQVDELFG